MKNFYKGFLNLTSKWWFILIVLVANFASFYILFALKNQFEALSGLPTFDTQNNLSPTLLLEQLPLYTGETLAAYYRFMAFDFVFPLVSAFFIVVIWTLLLRFNTWGLAQKLFQNGFPLLPLLVTAFDYGENIFLWLILNGNTGMISAALFCKQLKLSGLALTGGITGLFLLALLANLLYRFNKSRQSAS